MSPCQEHLCGSLCPQDFKPLSVTLRSSPASSPTRPPHLGTNLLHSPLASSTLHILSRSCHFDILSSSSQVYSSSFLPAKFLQHFPKGYFQWKTLPNFHLHTAIFNKSYTLYKCPWYTCLLLKMSYHIVVRGLPVSLLTQLRCC